MLNPLRLHTSPHGRRLLALKLILLNGERHVQQLRLLLHVHGLQSRRDRRTRVSARIHDMLAVMVLRVVQQRLDSRLREAPSTGVERLLLAPNNGLGIRIHVQVFLQLLPWEGVQLLDTRDGSVGELVLSAVLVECGINLSCAEDDPLDLLRVVDRLAVLFVGDDPAEVGIAGEFLDAGAGERVAEEGLGEEEDESCIKVSIIISQRLGGHVRFLNCLFICRRRMWNKLAGLVMYAICMLQSWCWRSSLSGDGKTRGSSLQSCRYLSIRPEECSGPCPS